MATTPTPLYRYPLDPTGVSPDNLVVGEEHQLSNRTVRCIAPTYGGFFADSCVVKDFATNMVLVRGTDYNFGELFEFPTGRYGREIFGLIAISKPGVTKVKIDYQALGGDYSYSMDAVIAMIDNLNIGDRPVAWPDIVGRPIAFDPASHFHDVGDVYGFEYIVHSLDLLRQAILLGDSASHDEIYKYVDTKASAQGAKDTAQDAAIAAHIADVTNPHQTTKAQVGLGNVQNYGVATQAEMNAGVSSALYVTPATVAAYVQNTIGSSLSTHVNDFNNPHRVTAAQVGSYTKAETDAKVNGSNTALTTHIQDQNNPHATTKAQVGLGSVENFPIATTVQAQNGVDTATYMTPRRVAEAISYQIGVVANNHFNDHGNPHATTAFQVGALALSDWNTAWNQLQTQLGQKQGVGNYAVMYTYGQFTDLVATGTIYSNNDIWAFNSDSRIKTDVRVIDKALEKLRKIRGVLYKYTPEAIAKLGMDERDYMGVIAQEIQAVAPEVVGLAPFDRDPVTGLSKSGKNYLTVQYDKLIALVIEASKATDSRVTEIARRMGFHDLV